MVFVRLKQKTRKHHTRLEETVNINRITSFKDYQEVLQTFYGFYKPLEVAASCVREIESLDFQARRKVSFLYQDLRCIGLRNSDIPQLPRCSQLPALPTLPEALGCLCVLKRATLGGRIIPHALQKGFF